jgi:hypothetical protein
MSPDAEEESLQSASRMPLVSVRPVPSSPADGSLTHIPHRRSCRWTRPPVDPCTDSPVRVCEFPQAGQRRVSSVASVPSPPTDSRTNAFVEDLRAAVDNMMEATRKVSGDVLARLDDSLTSLQVCWHPYSPSLMPPEVVVVPES